MIYYCDDCKRFLDESDVEMVCVYPQTHDSPAEYEYRCPYCGNEELQEAGTCEFCGEPIDPDSKLNFCEECDDYFDYMIEQMVEHIANEWGCEKEHARQALFEYIAEKY